MENRVEEASPVMKVYKGLSLVLEVIVMVIKMNYALLYALYKLIVPPEPKSVVGEVIFITGSGHGMGREVALRLGKLGATMVCVDINEKSNQETVDIIKNEKGRAFAYKCDVTDRNAVNELAAKVSREVGDVTILINNAGIMPCKPFLQHSHTDIQRIIDINLLSQHWTVQAFLPKMMERNYGHIVAMSSMAGRIGQKNLVPYCASKFGIRGLMEALQEELRVHEKDFSGIKLTVICPGIIDTGLAKNPTSRFPKLLKLVDPGDAADDIVDAIRRNYTDITIPSNLHYTDKFFRTLPVSFVNPLKDFMATKMEYHDG